MLTRAGWNNYLKQAGYLSLRMEQVVANPPDAIYWSAPQSNSLANLFVRHPSIQRIVAKSQTPQDENWRWQCPGPWNLELIDELARWHDP